MWSEPTSVQPGGRDRAPDELALVQAFINSHYDLEIDHGKDLLATPQALASWIAKRDPVGTRSDEGQLTNEDLARALAVREGLRTLAAGHGVGPTAESAGVGPTAAPADVLSRLNDAARGASLEVRLTNEGPRFVSSGQTPLDRMLATVLASTAAAMIDGSWARLKVCPGDHCGWAFYDHSRNQSGRWCSMSVCGGRAKARAHYRRHRGDG